ncbi:MAG: hypothetical protein ACXV5G_11975, partial [Halobacteriota archaeon]
MKADRKLVVVLLMSIIVVISVTTIMLVRSTSNTSPSGPTLTRTTASQLPLISPPAGANLTMTSIDVGQGDALLLTFPHNESMLIDGGKENQGATVVAYLNSTGITHLNGVVATHPD